MRVPAKKLLTIDRWLSSLNRLALRFPTTVSQRALSGSVVMIKLMGMGSIIRLLSLCKEQGVDFSRIILITFDSNREVCELLGAPGCLFIRTNSLMAFLGDCWRVRKQVAQLKPDWIIDFERCSNAVSLFSQWLARVSASRSIRFNTLLPAAGSHLSFNANELSFYEILMKGIELMPYGVPERQIKSTPDRETGKVIININCSEYLLARRYPREFFREVVISLHAKRPELSIMLTGSAAEHPYVQGLTDELTTAGIPVQNVAGTWSIQQLEMELRTCALFLSGDSGPLHLATLLGAPTVAIWGPTQPGHFGYADSDSLINVSLSLACAPCFVHPDSRPAVACGGGINCLRDLKPLMIVNAALSLMSPSVKDQKVFSPAASW